MDTASNPIAERNAAFLAALPDDAQLDETRTCGTCGKTKAKTVFCKMADWPDADSPLCQKCRNEREALKQEAIQDAQRPLVQLSTPDLIALHDDALARTLRAMSTRKLQEADAKDLAIVAKNVLLNKQLLENKPTQISGHGDADEMRELLNLVRRAKALKAKTIDVTPSGPR